MPEHRVDSTSHESAPAALFRELGEAKREIEGLQTENACLRNLCLQLEPARDERDALLADLAEIGRAIGCNHIADGLARCVRDMVSERDVARAAVAWLAAAHKQAAELEGDCEHQEFRLTRFQASQIARGALAAARAEGVIP